MAFPVKLLLGGIGLGTIGTGLGIEKLVSSGSKNTNLLTKGTSSRESIVVKKECRIHKLMKLLEGSFQRVEKEDLEREMKNVEEYKNIKKVCEGLGGKDIFISNKEQKGWKYHPEDQQASDYKTKFENYLRGLKLI
ncbi:hypothetical protein MHF_0701 [Mycoplasma haemofelis Ohio2]|uniref:Uncharacterized protein n=1 Tax=Mycoplasma haemofelis (strain Ohio2) TaxID=859194 RepID=F6FIC3_MYCHI|nr:hypothetical protein MHF_0701 [Mycoplasma haemofelis Ohio2]